MDLFVARQPIFDRASRVQGYELLYRSAQNLTDFDGVEASFATKQVLSNSLLTIGFEVLAGSKPAHVNFGRDLLLSGWHDALPRQSTIIEILETVEPDDEIVAACQRIRSDGYQLALDDFVFRPEYEPLLSVVNMVKMEIGGSSRAEQELLIRDLHD